MIKPLNLTVTLPLTQKAKPLSRGGGLERGRTQQAARTLEAADVAVVGGPRGGPLREASCPDLLGARTANAAQQPAAVSETGRV